MRLKHWKLSVSRWAALLGMLVAMAGCGVLSHDGSKLVPADQVPASVAAAADKVQVMTLPMVESTNCFPQKPVWVRRVDGVIRMEDIALYDNRRLDEAYHRIAFIDNERVGYCTPLGEVVISPRFDKGEHFQEGIAVVQMGDKYGYVDQFGEWIVRPELDFAYGFWFGLGAAKRQGRFGLVDHTGQWVKQPTFDYAAVVGGGIRAQSTDGEEGFLDARGEFIKSGKLGSYYVPPKASR